MLKSTVVSISGLVIWYALKFLLVYNPLLSAKKIAITFVNVLPAASVLGLSLGICSSDGCSVNIQDVAATAVVISSASVAVEMMQLRTITTAKTVMPGHAASAVALTYLSGASIVLEPQTTCSAAAVLLSTAAGTILALHYLYLFHYKP